MCPSQLMLGRQLRTTVPTLESKLQPVWLDLQRVRQTDEKTIQSYKRTYDNRHDVRPLPELETGNSFVGYVKGHKSSDNLKRLLHVM